ncbi:polyphenol oxidase family protein [Actinospongicola halichondriae]|uniref:polyphenol oxidase family protein n=1 Tax=Actinospongicola halichondriae TaxID=3236844 RepID=UPI003D49A55E
MHAARVLHSRCADGDFAIDAEPAALRDRRARFSPGAWTWLRQVHGSEVVVVREPGASAGAEADAAVTDVPGAVLAVHTADCVPVLFHDPASGVIGAAHAGWRGLAAGVIDRTVEAMAGLGGTARLAFVGPHIRGRCYDFGAADLDDVAARLGDDVRATTAAGSPALDLTAAVRSVLGRLEVAAEFESGCTACEPDQFFSHRARRDRGRHASTITLVP